MGQIEGVRVICTDVDLVLAKQLIIYLMHIGYYHHEASFISQFN